MDEMKIEFSYRTTDGRLFSGKDALKCSKEHQKRIDFRNVVKEIMPKMEELFKLKDIIVKCFQLIDRRFKSHK